jgi:hypothetical protein
MSLNIIEQTTEVSAIRIFFLAMCTLVDSDCAIAGSLFSTFSCKY